MAESEACVDPTSRPRLGVVTPLANEEDTVDDLLDRVLARIGPRDVVYCVLDNVSTDGTRERVEARHAGDPRVILLWAPENRCVVDAYFRGYRQALDDGLGWILEMDGGMSHDPDEIPRFLAAMSNGVDFAAGSRFVRGGSYSGPLSRWLLSRGGTLLANLLLGTRMKDMTSGFECFTADTLRDVVDRGVRSRAHFFQTEIRAMLHDRRWVEVPISYRNPSKRVGSSSVREALRNLWALRRDLRAARPNGSIA